MGESSTNYNQKIVFGCGAVIILAFFIFAAIGLYAISADRESTLYPGSIHLSNNSNYRGLPTHYTWNDSYRSEDNFNQVFTWYSVKFDMGAETRANGSCALLEKTDEVFRIERYMSVFVCQTEEGQLIFVNRATSIK